MRKTTLIIAIVLGVLLDPVGSVRSQKEARQSSSLPLTPCAVGDLKDARCGKYEVFEDRAKKTGRKIALNIAVLPATGKDRAPDPFVYFAGGPGSAATEDAIGIAQVFATIREHRDLLFVDQRGTGSSNPLNCNLFNPADPQSYFGAYFPLDEVRKCRADLESKADLTLYTTSIAADDMDEVRAALGYEKLNLFGGSYGTRAALEYLRRHPEHVRTVTLHGVAPTNQFMPRNFAKDTDRALRGIIGECAADKSCNKAYPNLKADADAVLKRLLQGSLDVAVRTRDGQDAAGSNGNGAATATVKLSRDLAAEAIRYMLYSPVPATRIPMVLSAAAKGNYVPLAEAALGYRREIVATGSNGMYLSVTCAEDVPWIKPGEGERLAAKTFLGDYRVRQQREACALWPRAQLVDGYSEPVRSSLPILIVTGEWDPVTPPSNGEGVAKYLSNSLHVIVPHGAHGLWGLDGIECLDKLNVRFIESGSVQGLDVSCMKSVKRRGWAVGQ